MSAARACRCRQRPGRAGQLWTGGMARLLLIAECHQRRRPAWSPDPGAVQNRWRNSPGRRRGRSGLLGVVAVKPVVVAERVLARERRVPGFLLRPVGEMMMGGPAPARLLHPAGPRQP